MTRGRASAAALLGCALLGGCVSRDLEPADYSHAQCAMHVLRQTYGVADVELSDSWSDGAYHPIIHYSYAPPPNEGTVPKPLDHIDDIAQQRDEAGRWQYVYSQRANTAAFLPKDFDERMQSECAMKSVRENAP
jgi:hypothetical protein